MFNLFKSKSNTSENGIQEEKEAATDFVSRPVLSPQESYTPATTPPVDEAKQIELDKLREYVESIKLSADHEYYPSENGFLTDGTLRRYMRARKWDLKAAKLMLENTMKWRREYRPDMLEPDYIRPEAETGKMYFNGFDKCGRPVWIMRPRLQNSKDEKRQVKHIVYCLERGIRLMPDEVENLAIIVDFKDSSMSDNPSIATCKTFLDILGNHYPERLGQAFVVKSPWFFFTTFKVISPFMDPVTKDKIKFVYDSKDKNSEKATSNEWVHLADHINANQLETEFGGEFKFKFDVDTYWPALLDKTGNPYKVINYH